MELHQQDVTLRDNPLLIHRPQELMAYDLGQQNLNQPSLDVHELPEYAAL